MPPSLRFSRFEVLQHPDGTPHLLGESAGVSIYLAREKEGGELVALRVPDPATQRNPSARHRFLEEAQEMAEVKHPHLAAVLYSSDTSAGAFCAMEFCDGLTLQKAVEEVGPLPWQEVMRLAMQLTSALAELDRHGLVNRGLRSTNLIVTTGKDGHAHLKLTEYGRVSDDALRDTIAATKSGFIQTPTYASPEEFLAVTPPDSRSLQYALGAVMWFCLTGRALFEGSQFEVMFQHVNTEPPWAKLPAMPSPVLAVLRRLLAKSATDRFATPAALMAALSGSTSGITGAMPITPVASATGPTVLAWLKARQTLSLEELHPVLQQAAIAMDAAAAAGTAPVDLALERVSFEIEGWPSLPEVQRGAMLRCPMSGWPTWKLKLSPATPADRAGKLGSGSGAFVKFCHRLLTGQGKDVERHVPTAALSPEGNAFFDKHLASASITSVSCQQLLALLCDAEEVVISDAADAGLDPLATRVVRSKQDAVPDSSPKRQEDQAWLARERDALERARRDLSAQEAERARRLAEEQAHVEKLRRSLEEQKQLLEDKRREQQRLEQELQLRAQLEFQKLQEEARAKESQMQHKREAAEQALRQREADFRAREQERFARLDQLKRENDAMEERVQEEFMTLRHIERRQAHRTASTMPAPVRPPPVPPVPVVQTPSVPPRQSFTMTQPGHQPNTGSIILARLAPIEVPQTVRSGERRQPVPPPPRPSRPQKNLVIVLIGFLVLGIVALLAAAALTMFTGGEEDSFEVSPVVVKTLPGEDSPIELEPPPPPEPPPHPGMALRALLSEAGTAPGSVADLGSRAAQLISQLAKLPPAEAETYAADLRRAADTWKSADAWLALAVMESDEDSKLECYLQASKLGSNRGHSLSGQMLLAQGLRSRHAGTIQQGVAKLSRAIGGGDAEAMLALGDAMYLGRGVRADREQGKALIQRAAELGHEPASEWLRKNR